MGGLSLTFVVFINLEVNLFTFAAHKDPKNVVFDQNWWLLQEKLS